MDSVQKFMLRIVRYSLGLFIIESLLIFIFVQDPLKYFLGLLLGYVFNLIFFRLMYLNAKSKVEMGVKGAKSFTRINYMVRYLITGVIFYVAAVHPKLSLLTCFIGLLNIKMAIYVSAFYDFLKSKKS